MSLKNRRKRLAQQQQQPGEKVRLSHTLVRLAADLKAADDAAGTPDLSPKWVQIATAGDYKGYAGGAFTFDDKTFGQIITNFRAHPSFLVGSAGVGVEDVIPWDFNHASASFAADGSIPITGTPAQGWIQDLKTVADAGGTQLWALTSWLEPARTYILTNKYKWASVVVGFDCRDPKTNLNIGAVLESVALTNNPFIEGMQKLAADKRGGQGKNAMTQANQGRQVAADYYYGQAAQGPDDALEYMRCIFALPATSDVGAVLAQISLLATWAKSGGAPLGVDLDDLVGKIRQVLNLPALTSTDEVFAETTKLLSALLDQQALEELENEATTAPAETAPDTTPTGPNSAAMEKSMSLIKVIATRCGVQETEAAASQAVEGMFTFRTALAKKFGLVDIANDTVVLEAAGDAASAKSKLSALLAALGIEDSSAAVEKIAGLMKQSADLEAAMPELKSLREAAAASDAKEGDAEVEKVMNSMGSDNAGVRIALTTLRKTDKPGFQKQFADVLAAAPVAAGGAAPVAGHAYLSTPLTGGRGGQERSVTQNADGSIALSAPGAGSKTGAPATGKKKVDLSLHSGRNRVERAMDYVRASTAGGDKWDFTRAFDAASALLNDKNVEIVDIAAA